MAQGNHKLGKAKKSRGAQRRKASKSIKKTRKGNARTERNKAIIETTKAINRKNERLIAAKAMNAGTSFSLTDISEKGKWLHIFSKPNLDSWTDLLVLAPTGKNESKRQTSARDKKQNKATKLSDRLQVQINKLS